MSILLPPLVTNCQLELVLYIAPFNHSLRTREKVKLKLNYGRSQQSYICLLWNSFRSESQLEYNVILKRKGWMESFLMSLWSSSLLQLQVTYWAFIICQAYHLHYQLIFQIITSFIIIYTGILVKKTEVQRTGWFAYFTLVRGRDLIWAQIWFQCLTYEKGAVLPLWLTPHAAFYFQISKPEETSFWCRIFQQRKKACTVWSISYCFLKTKFGRADWSCNQAHGVCL